MLVRDLSFRISEIATLRQLQSMALRPVPNFCMTRPCDITRIEFHVKRAPARRPIGDPDSPASHRSAERLDVRRGGSIFLLWSCDAANSQSLIINNTRTLHNIILLHSI